ncbi:hypothetical protein [Nonomuraea lactucae]|uniref:hypothetical protein n=1 Tax=Nonomuraea lactucae TaxID=2249762 RepID=UPI0013B3C995|nr:hypothetical protein [Nonomuraea lactucae]
MLSRTAVHRIPYELCVLVALRKAIRRRESRVEGGKIRRNPEADLPSDFDDNRDVHYQALPSPATRHRSSPACSAPGRHRAAAERGRQGEHAEPPVPLSTARRSTPRVTTGVAR